MDVYKYSHYMKVFVTNPGDTIKRVRGSMANAEKYTTISDTFIKQEYYWLVERLIEDTTVIDIGAHMGDTAIYFAQFEKVKRVIAYEPTPVMYKTASENLDRLPANFTSKIVLNNMAIGDEGIKTVPRDIGSHVSNFHTVKSSRNGQPIESIPLEKVLNGLRNVMIKCDCEGGEYSIFKDSLDLSNVYAIQMEYHFGAERIVRLLRSKGFETDYKRTFRKEVGFIYAHRRTRSMRKR